MSNVVLIPEETKSPVKDYISLILLVIATIVLSIGSFWAWGPAIGLVVIGAVLYVTGVLFGLRK